jgi:hypothetical protein
MVCSTELYSLVLSLGYLVFSQRQVPWEGIRLGSSATKNVEKIKKTMKKRRCGKA